MKRNIILNCKSPERYLQFIIIKVKVWLSVPFHSVPLSE